MWRRTKPRSMNRVLTTLLFLVLTLPGLALDGVYYLGEYEGDDFHATLTFRDNRAVYSRLDKEKTRHYSLHKVSEQQYILRSGNKQARLFLTGDETFLLIEDHDDDLMLGLKQRPEVVPNGEWTIPSLQEKWSFEDGRYRISSDAVLEGQAVCVASDKEGCLALVLLGEHTYELLYLKELGDGNMFFFQHEERYFLAHPAERQQPDWFGDFHSESKTESQTK